LSFHDGVQIAFHRAYRAEHPGTTPASFPNDELFRYISVDPYIPIADLRRAVVRTTDHGNAVEITISAIARKKLNALASWNLRASRDRDFNAHVGLGLVADGEPALAIQGIRQLNANVLWLSLDSGSKMLEKAHRWANRINDPNRP
jgi:hypothetical protein